MKKVPGPNENPHDFLGDHLGKSGILSFTMVNDESDDTKDIIRWFTDAHRDGTPVSLRYVSDGKITEEKYRVIKFEKVGNDSFDVEITVFDQDDPTAGTPVFSIPRIPLLDSLAKESEDRAREDGKDGS